MIDGRDYVLEYPIRADFALVRAHTRRPAGQPRLPQDGAQLRPDHGRRGRAPPIVAGRRRSCRSARLDPENVVTPCIYVDRVVRVDVADAAAEDGQ